MNKKGNLIPLVILGMVIITFMFVAIFAVIGGGILTFTSSTVEGITSELGMVGPSNLSAISDVSIKPVNDTIQMFKWGSGILLIFGLIGILAFSASIRFNPSTFLIGMWLLLVIIMVISSIFVSNIYEDFLNGDDDIALELQENTAASFLILYMPLIVTIISFIGGIIIFSGAGEGFT